MRESHSLSWFEWEPSVGIALPGAYGQMDFNNRGEKGIQRNRELVERTDRFLYLQAGLWFQFGDFGINATADQLRYDVAGTDNASLSLALTRMHLVGAYSFLGNQLCVGGGARAIFVNVNDNDNTKDVITMLGAMPEIGVIVKPNDVPWRIGATARAGVSAGDFDFDFLERRTTPSGGQTEIKRRGNLVLPNTITQPWELEAGVAYQLGPRPLNPAWIDPGEHEAQLKRNIERSRAERAALHRAEIASLPGSTYEEVAARELRIARIAAAEEDIREEEDKNLREASQRLNEERRARYMNWPRERVLLLASLLVIGSNDPRDKVVALEGFMDQKLERVGNGISLAPRFAVESEPVPNWIKLRAGVYFEPSRFADGTYRQHFTFGQDVKLFPWDVFGILGRAQTWRLSAFLDVAPRYQNFGFAIGIWH